MILDLKTLFSGGSKVKIEYSFSPDQSVIEGCGNITVAGNVTSDLSEIMIKAKASFTTVTFPAHCKGSLRLNHNLR